jgi:uncharacterized coiled-coil protein SlyX
MSQTLKSALVNGVVTVVLSVVAGLGVWYQVVEKRLNMVETRLEYQERELREVQRSALIQRDTVEGIARDVSYIRGTLSR